MVSRRRQTGVDERKRELADKRVIVGFLPEVVVLDAGDQAEWFSNVGNLKIEFDPARCPFSSNVLQAPAGVRLLSGPVRPGTNPGAFKYKLSLDDRVLGQGEILFRGR
jgi:hypothetical protein